MKQFFDKRLLQAFTGDPVKFGFLKPDYKIYESHPIVNTLILILTIAAWVLSVALWLGKRLRLTEHGPEKLRFLRYCPCACE